MIRLTLALIALSAAAGASAQSFGPLPPGVKAPPPSAAPPGAPGEALFVEKCAMCHRRMGMGTVLLSRRMDPSIAELEKRGDLTADYVLQAARTGIGNMPKLSRGEVSDLQLRQIADYLARNKK